MNFLHNDLGYLNGGEVIEVNLDHAANVRLMDTSNFHSYRQGARYKCFGGEARRSRAADHACGDDGDSAGRIDCVSTIERKSCGYDLGSRPSALSEKETSRSKPCARYAR